jgi:hypothetical protein
MKFRDLLEGVKLTDKMNYKGKEVKFHAENGTVWFQFKNKDGKMTDVITAKYGGKLQPKTPDLAITNWIADTSEG